MTKDFRFQIPKSCLFGDKLDIITYKNVQIITSFYFMVHTELILSFSLSLIDFFIYLKGTVWLQCSSAMEPLRCGHMAKIGHVSRSQQCTGANPNPYLNISCRNYL
jgi:hypothetical protein